MNKNKNNFTFALVFIAGIAIASLFSFRAAPEQTAYQYMQISTIESIVPGGLGRSRILSTDQSGTMIEKDLKNFYSMAGINFGNVANNDKVIVERLNESAASGWEIYSVSTGVQSPSENQGGGIFITRYLFRKAL